MTRKQVFLLLGPAAFVLVKLVSPEGLTPAGQAVLASTCWVAIWWITEAVELEVTSLVPLVLLPMSGGQGLSETATSYAHPFIFLFMGGFIIGLSIEKCGLHKRIAYRIIKFVGTSEKKVILGFMLATAFLSMWISNTATSIMMLPIGMSVAGHFNSETSFAKNLMLGIGYAASIGGMATLIGTPPNIIFAGVIKQSLHIEISFLQWMLFAFPFSIVLLLAVWFYLSRYKMPEADSKQQVKLAKLGDMSVAEKRVLVVFAAVAFLWVTRSFLLEKILPALDDTVIAMMGAISLFIIPAGKENGKLMDWKTAKKLPWGVLLIFGAGLSIAKGFSSSDLASWLASQFLLLNTVPVLIILLLVIAGINFLTEITSNTATASMILPILITLATSLGMSPVKMMIGAVLASSCAFMLPVATPPNAVVFSSGKIKIGEMVRAGVWINLMSIALIFLFVQWWWTIVWQ